MISSMLNLFNFYNIMSIVLELLIHPMCPFAQRALLVKTFKNIACTVREVDLASKPSWFLDVNPRGVLPALRVINGEKEVLLHESLVVSEYLDSFPGPFLYPREANGVPNPLKKAQIDLLIASKIEPLRKQLGLLYFNNSPTVEEIKEFKRTLASVNGLVPDGTFFNYGKDCKNQISFADVMALPLIDRLLVFKDQHLPWYEGLQLENLEKWHKNIRSLDFTKGFEVSKQRFTNLRQQMQKGNFRGLQLPVEIYDSPKL